MTDDKKVILIGLSGCSSSGKTTIAKLTSTLIPGCTLIHEDDFYKHDNLVPIDANYGIQNWDSPEALDFPLFRKELDHIRSSGGEISAKLIHNNNVDDLSKFNISQDTLNHLRNKYNTLEDRGVKIVIVDGFMLFNDNEVRSKFDIKILIRSPYQQLKQRRAARNGYQTLDSFWVDPPYYFDEFVYKSYSETHGPLFIDKDVEGKLDPVRSVDINDFMNSDEVAIEDTLEWVCNTILDSCCEL